MNHSLPGPVFLSKHWPTTCDTLSPLLPIIPLVLLQAFISDLSFNSLPPVPLPARVPISICFDSHSFVFLGTCTCLVSCFVFIYSFNYAVSKVHDFPIHSFQILSSFHLRAEHLKKSMSLLMFCLLFQWTAISGCYM